MNRLSLKNNENDILKSKKCYIIAYFVAAFLVAASVIFYLKKIEENGVVANDLYDGTYQIVAIGCSESKIEFSYENLPDLGEIEDIDIVRQLMLFEGEKIGRLIQVKGEVLSFLIGNSTCSFRTINEKMVDVQGEFLTRHTGKIEMTPRGCKMQAMLNTEVIELDAGELTDNIDLGIRPWFRNQIFFDGEYFFVRSLSWGNYSKFGCKEIDRWYMKLKKIK